MAVHRLVARNRAAHHPNKVHDDAFARSVGLRGGLVPGVDLYAYLCGPVVSAWGEAWLRRGAMTVRFERPVCDGDELEVWATRQGDDHLLVQLAGADGRRAQGVAVPAHDGPAPQVEDFPWRPLPSDPPAASAEALRSTPVLGTVELTVDRSQAEGQLAEVGERLDLYARAAIVHPGHLLRLADRALSANVRLKPWMHVSSAVRHFDLARWGDPLSARARVMEVFERKGHRFVQLDVAVFKAPDSPVMRVRPYTAVYEPAFVRAAEGDQE